ncbi:MAG TPA: PspC domain-containing protein [Acidimicrobiales bacterium]
MNEPLDRDTMTLPPPTPPAWQLLRSQDRVLGGVCSGIATSSGIDRTLVRLAFIAAALTGLGVIAYIILWIVVPLENPAAGRVVSPASPETARWLKVAVVIAAVAGVATLVGAPFGWGQPGFDGFGAPLGFILVVVGLAYLWSRRRTGPVSSATPPPAGTTWAAPAAPVQPVSQQAVPSSSGAVRGPSAGLVAARVVGWLAVFGSLVMVAGLSAMLWSGALTTDFAWLLWTAVTVSLVTLVATTAGAKRAWPILASIVLAGATVGLVAGVTTFDGPVGERIDTPATLEEVKPSYDMAVGRRVLDLSQVEWREGTTSIDIDHQVGQVDVVLPADVALHADVTVRLGEAKVLDRSEGGFDADLVVNQLPPDAAGVLDLDIEMGTGQVRVCRAAFDTGGTRGCGSL